MWLLYLVLKSFAVSPMYVSVVLVSSCDSSLVDDSRLKAVPVERA